MKKIIIALLFFCISNILSAQPTVSDIQPAGGGSPKSSACIGEMIRVIGGGFQSSGMTITINGGTPFSVYNFIDGNNIELQVPPGTPPSGPGLIVTALSLSSNSRSLSINPGTNITIAPQPQNVCEGATYSFSVAAAGGAIAYNWKRNGTPFSTATTVSGTAAVIDSGDIFVVDIINSTCNTIIPTSPVKLTVNKKPNNPPTLPNLEQCQNGTFTLNAPPPNIGSGTWSCVSNCTGVGFANINIPNTQVTGVPENVFPQLRWNVINGACASQSDVTVLNYGMPTSTSVIYGADTNICITSGPVTLVGNSPGGTFTNVDWNLQGPATGTFTSPTTNYTSFTPTSGAGIYIVEYYIHNGACNNNFAKQITVHDMPTPIAGSGYTGCFGSPIMLSGTVMNASSFVWVAGGGSGSLTAVSSLTPTYNSFGSDSLGVTFAVSLTASNAGCAPVSDTTTITIRTKPYAFIPSGSDATICSGGSVNIPVNFTGNPPFSGIGLFNGTTNTDLGTVSTTTVNVPVVPTSSTNYTLAPVGSFIDGFSCPGSWNGSSFITVAPGASANISITPAAICAGDNANLTIIPSGGGGPTWKIYVNTGGPNSILTVSGTYSTTISPVTNTTYTVDSIETAGCGKIKLTGISKSIIVNTPPVVSASMGINLSDDTLCKGENSTVEITGVQANTVYRIVKNYNNIVLDSILIGNTIPTSANVLIPFAKFTSGKIDTIKFMARKPGCAIVPSVTRSMVWTSGLTNPVITASSTLTACENKILQLTPLSNILYQWYEGTNTIVGAIGSKDTAFFSGSYSVKAKDTLLCTLASNTINVDYSALQPIVSVTNVSSTETKLSSTAAATTYYWYAQTSTGIKKIQGAAGNTISVYFDGNYYLGTITNSCFFMSAAYVVSGKLGGSLLKQSFVETDSTIILSEMDFSSDATVYPNPVSGSDFTVDYITGNVTKISFILYNPQGLPVQQKEVEGNGLIRLEMPTKYLTPGVYNLYINDGVKQVRRNVMIY